MNQNEKALAEALKGLVDEDGVNLQEPSDAMAIARNFGVIISTLASSLESQPVTSEPIGWGWKNEMGITEVRTDRMSKEMIAKLNAFPVYASPQPVAGQVSNTHGVPPGPWEVVTYRDSYVIQQVGAGWDAPTVATVHRVGEGDGWTRSLETAKAIAWLPNFLTGHQLQTQAVEALGKRVDALKLICRYAGVPDVVVETFMGFDKPTEEDIKRIIRTAPNPQAPAVEVPANDHNELAVSFAHESVEALLERFKTDPEVCAELTVIKEALLASRHGGL